MIDILAAANTEYQSFFSGDWIIFGIGLGIAWAAKGNFNFGCFDNDDDEHMYY